MGGTGDPGEIIGQALGDVDGNQLRQLVRVTFPDECFNAGIVPGGSLDYHGKLTIFVQLSLPVVN